MPFTINSVGKHSSNKHKTLAHKDEFKSSQQAFDGTTPIPFIDRLTVTLTVPTKEDGKDMWNAYCLAKKDEGAMTKASCSKGYSRGHKLHLPSLIDSKKWPHYQVAWQDDCISRARLDFVPVDLGYDGMVELHAALTGLMD